MSFLYKALLKNEQTSGPESKPSTTPEHPLETNKAGMAPNASNQMFASPQQHTQVPWLVWLLLCFFILVTGLLGGYVFGLKEVNTVPTELVTPVIQNTPEKTVEQATQTSIAKNNKPQLKSKQETAPELEVTARVDERGEMITGINEPVLEDSTVAEDISNLETTDMSDQEPNYPIEQANTDDALKLQDIPEQLKASFAAAVKETETISAQQLNVSQVSTDSAMTAIDELSEAEQALLPAITYQMHIYASDKSARWVKLNNKIMYEGDELRPGLTLLEIRQDMIVWETDYRRFSQTSLEDFNH